VYQYRDLLASSSDDEKDKNSERKRKKKTKKKKKKKTLVEEVSVAAEDLQESVENDADDEDSKQPSSALAFKSLQLCMTQCAL
jgi:hypothetical protein